ncbi:MAG: 2-oxo acid dehydrogenase subunit E2, partial [Chloroflexi bacterium]|nr:2-oxo acid dehydrogenase subunit E2 [Chloroflexota bacterium]
MPQMGYDMQQGTVARWLKGEGEKVSRGEIIAEIETDKALVEMEAYDSGVLRKILVAAGVAVPVGSVIGIIAGADEHLPKTKEPSPSKPAEAPPSVPAPRKEPKAEAAATASAGEVRISPVARRLAEEKGIDIAKVKGSGPSGRITREDILAYEEQMRQTVPPQVPKTSAPEAEKAAPATIPLSRMRQAIARLTSRSMGEVPIFYVTAELDMTGAMDLRHTLNKSLEEAGIRISVNDMVVRAATKALMRYPQFNSFFQDDKLLVNPSINVGIAVAMEEGLVVPAIMNCESKSLPEIAKASRDLVER